MGTVVCGRAIVGRVMFVSWTLPVFLAFVLLLIVWPRFRRAVGMRAIVALLVIWTLCRKLMRFFRLAKPAPKVRRVSTDAIARANRAIAQAEKRGSMAAAAA